MAAQERNVQEASAERNGPLVFTGCLAIILVIFVIDLNRTPDMMMGFFYVIPVIIGFWSPRRRAIDLIALIASIASITALFLAPSGVPPYMVFNRPFSIILIWVSAMIGDLRWQTENALRQANEALKLSESMSRAIMDTATDPIFIKDRESRLRMANPATFKVIGKPEDEVLGRSDQEFYDDPAIGSQIVETDRRIMETGVGEEVEEKVQTAEGVRTFLSSKVPHRDSSGKIIGLIGMAHDITDRKRAERELEETKARLEAIISQMPLGFTVIEPPDGRVVYRNKEVRALFRNELLPDEGEDYEKWQVFHMDGSPVMPEERMVDRSLREGIVIRDQVQMIIRGDGSCGYLSTTSAPVRDKEGRIVAAIAMNIDVTDKILAERELKKERERLQQVIESVPVAIMLSDKEGNIELLNQKVSEIWAGAAPKAYDMADFELHAGFLPGTDVPVEPEEWPLTKVLLTGEPVFDEEYDIQRSDGTRGTVIASAIPMKDDNGALLGSLMALTDMSKQRATERELARSNLELQQFAYVVSHDLREPLRMVVSYLGLLEQRYGDKLEKGAREYMDFAVNGGTRMQQLIDDLLAYSRVNASSKPKEPTDLEKVLARTLTNLDAAVTESGAIITHEPLPMVRADESQMVQLFQNLIGNSIKYRGERPPEVHITPKRTGKEWTFSVKDNGIGIEPEYHQRIFEMFQRLHSSERYEGTGIGLAIAKRIVEKHGGRIWVESEAGKGATFIFTLLA
jgi:PAS domain S-box-containing protein